MPMPPVPSTAFLSGPLIYAGGSCPVHDWVHSAINNSWQEDALPKFDGMRENGGPHLETSAGKAERGSAPPPALQLYGKGPLLSVLC